MKGVQFVLAEKVSGLAVLVCVPVGPASALALAKARRAELAPCDDAGKPLGAGNFELGAACAAAAARVEAKLLGPGALKSSHAVSVQCGVHEDQLCIGVVVDKTPSRVKGIVQKVLKQVASVSAAEHARLVRGLGQTPRQTDECIKALKRGAAEASVIVCGPLAKPEKQRAAVDKAKAGADAAGLEKVAGAAPKSDRGASVAEGQHALPAKGAALVLLADVVGGLLHLGGAICGDQVVISAKSATAAANAAANKDKKAALQTLLGKDGETGRVYWRACASGVHPGAAVPTAKALADAVFAALAK